MIKLNERIEMLKTFSGREIELTQSINSLATNAAKTYSVSEEFLLNGNFQKKDLYGLVDDTIGGIRVYFPEAISIYFAQWLFKNKPQLDDDADPTDYVWEDAKWEACHLSLSELKHDKPENKLYLGDCCIGLCTEESDYSKKIQGFLNEAFKDLAKKRRLSSDI